MKLMDSFRAMYRGEAQCFSEHVSRPSDWSTVTETLRVQHESIGQPFVSATTITQSSRNCLMVTGRYFPDTPHKAMLLGMGPTIAALQDISSELSETSDPPSLELF